MLNMCVLFVCELGFPFYVSFLYADIQLGTLTRHTYTYKCWQSKNTDSNKNIHWTQPNDALHFSLTRSLSVCVCVWIGFFDRINVFCRCMRVYFYLEFGSERNVIRITIRNFTKWMDPKQLFYFKKIAAQFTNRTQMSAAKWLNHNS